MNQIVGVIIKCGLIAPMGFVHANGQIVTAPAYVHFLKETHQDNFIVGKNKAYIIDMRNPISKRANYCIKVK